MNEQDPILELLQKAVTAREDLFDANHESAFRLFNGFVEGCPDLVVDLYAQTAVIHNYAKPAENGRALVETAQTYLLQKLPWLQTILLKTRQAETETERNGVRLWGKKAMDRTIREHGVRYALNLTMNRDASFYLDTRNLRHWILQNLAGKRVLNTFAYTGSLGVAAMAAGASQAIHVDINRQYMNLAKDSYSLNGIPIDKQDFITGDFFPVIKRLNRQSERFDCVILDPPIFSTTDRGTVDGAQNMIRLINKVRPLVQHDGRIIAINNALFTSGEAYMASLNSLCQDGYVSIETRIDVAEDFTGFPQTRLTPPITDPAPFNYPTKIVILKIQHK